MAGFPNECSIEVAIATTKLQTFREARRYKFTLSDTRGVKITEAMMFRAVVVVGIAMVPVVLLAAVVDPLAGAILFGLEALIALWFVGKRLKAARAQRPRRDLPPEAAVPEAESVEPPVDSIR